MQSASAASRTLENASERGRHREINKTHLIGGSAIKGLDQRFELCSSRHAVYTLQCTAVFLISLNGDRNSTPVVDTVAYSVAQSKGARVSWSRAPWTLLTKRRQTATNSALPVWRVELTAATVVSVTGPCSLFAALRFAAVVLFLLQVHSTPALS